MGVGYREGGSYGGARVEGWGGGARRFAVGELEGWSGGVRGVGGGEGVG